jgi:membrane protein DedA with SNARE-associated domain
VEEIAIWLVDIVKLFGYPGLFVMAFLESTFIPIPSAATMVPTGYLVHQGEMNLFMALGVSTAGCIGGALLNYVIARFLGRRFLVKYCHYMLFGPEKMEKLDVFFARHGEISMFTGRLLPGVRHVISFPAGLAHMNVKKFCFYTGLGGGLWMATLICVGYLIGDNKELVKAWMPYVLSSAVTVAALMIVAYVFYHRRKNKGTAKVKGEKVNDLAA